MTFPPCSPHGLGLDIHHLLDHCLGLSASAPEIIRPLVCLWVFPPCPSGALLAHGHLHSWVQLLEGPSSAQKLAWGQLSVSCGPPGVNVGAPGTSWGALEGSGTPCELPHLSSYSSIRLETRGPTDLLKPQSGSRAPGSELWELMNNASSWAHPALQGWSLWGWDKSARGW